VGSGKSPKLTERVEEEEEEEEQRMRKLPMERDLILGSRKDGERWICGS
jgi:hypothetical protein